MLNYHRPQPLIDPHVDLARVDYKLFSHNAWILPQMDTAQLTKGNDERR